MRMLKLELSFPTTGIQAKSTSPTDFELRWIAMDDLIAMRKTSMSEPRQNSNSDEDSSEGPTRE